MVDHEQLQAFDLKIMQPQYADFIAALIDKKRNDGRYKHWPSPPTDREVAYTECYGFSKALVDAFPELRMERGFYVCKDAWGDEHPTEHWWTVDAEGTIIDPSKVQFGNQDGRYSRYDDHEFPARIGACPNCGGDIYEGEGVGGLCSEECCVSYEAYVTREARGYGIR